MNTPITDAAWQEWLKRGSAGESLASPMMLLELDRAALMEALEGLIKTADATGMVARWECHFDLATDALSAARANFPTP